MVLCLPGSSPMACPWCLAPHQPAAPCRPVAPHFSPPACFWTYDVLEGEVPQSQRLGAFSLRGRCPTLLRCVGEVKAEEALTGREAKAPNSESIILYQWRQCIVRKSLLIASNNMWHRTQLLEPSPTPWAAYICDHLGAGCGPHVNTVSIDSFVGGHC